MLALLCLSSIGSIFHKVNLTKAIGWQKRNCFCKTYLPERMHVKNFHLDCKHLACLYSIDLNTFSLRNNSQVNLEGQKTLLYLWRKGNYEFKH